MKTIVLIAAFVLSLSLFAADRPAPEARARYYIYSGLLTQAAPAMVADQVALGPELSKRLAMPVHADGAKVYHALVSLTDGKPLEVRKATPEEIRAYGARPGLHEKQPFYAVDAGDLKLLVQYDLQADVISFVGERNTLWDEPKLIVASAAPAAAGATRPSPARLDWTGFFSFDSAALTEEARATLDREIVARLATMEVLSVDISGHADPIGSEEYNHKLSEWRAGAVADYLAARGVDPARIGTLGFGKTQPVKSCPADVARAELVACLAPNRRVVVEVAAIPR
jgi:outer membrane protein OmpA-like peptidoglycan-associated protein